MYRLRLKINASHSHLRGIRRIDFKLQVGGSGAVLSHRQIQAAERNPEPSSGTDYIRKSPLGSDEGLNLQFDLILVLTGDLPQPRSVSNSSVREFTGGVVLG